MPFFISAWAVFFFYRDWAPYQSYMKFGYIIAAICILGQLLTWVCACVVAWAVKDQERRRMIKRLQGLTPKEKEVLRKYSEERALDLNISEPAVARLVYDKILVVLFQTELNNPFFLYPVSVDSDVWEYLDKHREVLGSDLPVISLGDD